MDDIDRVLIFYDEECDELGSKTFDNDEDLINYCEGYVDPKKCIVIKGKIIAYMKLKDKLSLVDYVPEVEEENGE